MKERKIVKAFTDSCPIHGKVYKGFRVGYRLLPDADKWDKALDFDTYAAKLAARTYVKRLDLLIVNDSEIWIVEVKRRLNPSAIGQVYVYKALFSVDYPNESRPIKLGIAYVYDDPLTQLAAEQQNISLFKVDLTDG